MKDFIYEGSVRIIYGAGQMETVVQEIARLGKRLLVIPTASFLSGGHYEPLKSCLAEDYPGVSDAVSDLYQSAAANIPGI